MSKIHLLTESSIQWLKQQAKALKKSKSIALSQAQYEIAVQHGFSNWKNLIDTFKFETNSPYRLRNIRYDRSLIKPFDNESETLQAQLLLSQGIDFDEYKKNSDQHFHADFFGGREPKYHDLVSQARDKANAKIAANYGFDNWSQLLQTHLKEVIVEEYSLEQKIGAISRKLGKSPSTIINTIHIAIEIDNDGLMGLKTDDWEQVGFVEDHNFSRWMSQNHVFFQESSAIFFRLVSIDTKSFSKVESHLIKIGEKLDLFFPLFSSAIWINGKIDTNIIQSIKDDYLFHEPDIALDSIDYPPAEVPTEIWRAGY